MNFMKMTYKLLELLPIAPKADTDFRVVDAPGYDEFWVVATDPDTIVIFEGWIDGCTAGDDRNLDVAQLPNGQGIGNEQPVIGFLYRRMLDRILSPLQRSITDLLDRSDPRCLCGIAEQSIENGARSSTAIRLRRWELKS
jgi:hypothetical protein